MTIITVSNDVGNPFGADYTTLNAGLLALNEGDEVRIIDSNNYESEEFPAGVAFNITISSSKTNPDEFPVLRFFGAEFLLWTSVSIDTNGDRTLRNIRFSGYFYIQTFIYNRKVLYVDNCHYKCVDSSDYLYFWFPFGQPPILAGVFNNTIFEGCTNSRLIYSNTPTTVTSASQVLQFNNCTFVNNQTENLISCLFFIENFSDAISVNNCIFHNNEGNLFFNFLSSITNPEITTIWHNNYTPDATDWGSNNQVSESNPFVSENPTKASDYIVYDYTLAAGNANPSTAEITDIAGELRPSPPDIGAWNSIEYVVPNPKPIVLSATKKTYPGRNVEIVGINFSGNVLVNIDNEYVAIDNNKDDEFLKVKTPLISAGKTKLSVSTYTVIDGNIVVLQTSNEVDIYVFDSLRGCIENYCRLFGGQKYTNQLLKLWKYGQFALKPGSMIHKLLTVIGVECEYYNYLLCEIAKETNPLTADQLLVDWEIEYGLPEPCAVSQTQDIDFRKNELQRKYLSIGDSSPEYFEWLCEQLGFEVVVRSNNVTMTNCEDNCESPVVAQEMNYVWYVDVLNVEFEYANCEGTCEDPLDWTGAQEIACFLNRLKPAHTTIIFRYFTSGYLLAEDENILLTEDSFPIYLE